MGRGALSIAKLCDYAAIGRTTAFAEIKAGRLIAHKRGRTTIILIEDADAWLQSLPRVRPTVSDAVVPVSHKACRSRNQHPVNRARSEPRCAPASEPARSRITLEMTNAPTTFIPKPI
jgi:hypothetical protein